MSTLAGLASLAGEAEAGARVSEQLAAASSRLQEIRSREEFALVSNAMQQQARTEQMQWEYSKIQLSQQNDFEVREMLRMQGIQAEAVKRQRKQDEYDTLIEAIDANETVSDEEKEKFKLNAQSKFSLGAYAPTIQREADGMKQAQGVMKMQRDMENDLVFYQDIINKFSTTEDLNWIPFSGGRGVHDLARQDDAGNWRPATDQDKAMLDYARMQMALKMQQLIGAGGGTTGGGPGDILGIGGI